MHAHFVTSVRMRENAGWTRSVSNSVVAVASKLNEHASRLRERPAGFNQSACSLIQRATALSLMLREAWGNQWDDELLEVSVPDVEPPAEWLEKREQTLHQWHRLLAEVGNTWSHWTPLKLGPMDSQHVEAVIRQQQQAAVSLAEELTLLPEDFHELTVPKIEQLNSVISKSRLTVLTDMLPNLLAFLWQAPDNAGAVARLERDLEEFYRQSAKAQRHLRITADNRDYVAARATEALNAVGAVVSPRCSVSSAKVSLKELNETLNWAEDLFAYASLNPVGIHELWGAEQTSREQAQITWKHVESLTNHRSNPDLQVPSGGKLQLARYVQEDAARQSEARAFAQRLSRYHTSVARLKLRVADATRLQEKGPAGDMDESARWLWEHSLGGVRLCELPELEQTLSQLVDSLRDLSTKTPEEFSTCVFGSATLNVADLRNLAMLADLPVKLLQVPTNGTEKIIGRLIGNSNPSSALLALSAAVLSYQTIFRDLCSWFPEIQIGQPLEAHFLDSQRKAAHLIHELGLQSQTLESVTQLTERVGTMRMAVQNALDAFTTHFKPWPRLPPESLGHIHLAKALFLLLVNRPQAPIELPIEALCSQANADIISAAIMESHELQHFREQNLGRVAFRGLPDVETIAVLRREWRSLCGRWWRWFSGRYRKARKLTRSFVKPPFSSDEDTIALLDELEAHERRRTAFHDSSAGNLLGGMFSGIETRWQTVEPTLDWIRELKSATQSSDVIPFVRSSLRSAESLSDGVRVIEILTQLIEQNREEFSSIVSLSLLSADPWSVKLQELDGSLFRTETLLKELVERIQAQARLQPHATFSELTSRIIQLESLQQLTLALSRHTALAEPVEATNLDTDALNESAAWLSELAKRNVAPRIIDAVIGRNLETDRHFPLIQSAAVCARQITALNEACLNQEASWLSEETNIADLQSRLMLVLRATVSTRTQAIEWTFHEHLTILEIRESLGDVHEIEAATKAFVAWKEVLREEPALLSHEQITSTLDWLDALHEHGATGGMLRWLLLEETGNRLHWWQELVTRAKELRDRVRKLQDRFALPLHETQAAVTLATWSSQTADRNAKVMSALEIIESHSQSSDFTVHDLAQATAALGRAIDLEVTLQEWRERLGLDPTRLEVARIQDHRQWAAVARGLSPALGNWLAATDTTRRCETVIGLEVKLAMLKKAIKVTRDSLASFGDVREDGPFRSFNDRHTA